jgi:hypothetical protein
MRRLVEVLVAGILGAVSAIVGGIAHRSYPPVGVILSVLLVLMAAVFVRTWAGWTGVIAFAVPFVILTYLFTRVGPGGSLLIANDGLGWSWLYGGAGAVVIACLLPARMLGGGRSVPSA